MSYATQEGVLFQSLTSSLISSIKKNARKKPVFFFAESYSLTFSLNLPYLLYYSYGGKVSDEDLKANAKDIIDAADKFGVVGLKLEAEASFVNSTNITMDNVIDNLLYADAKNCALLKEAVLDFLVDNGSEATKKVSFENVPSSVIPGLLAAMARGKEVSNAIADANDLSTLRVNSLRKLLHEKGLDIDGSRETMIALLEENYST